MTNRKYTYKGKEYSYSDLQGKYGENTDAAISKFGFEEVKPSPTKYLYNDKEYTYEDLESKYGDKTQEAIDKFGFKVIGSKKKEDTSIVPQEDLVSSSEDGSSDSQKFEEGTHSWNQEKIKQNNPSIVKLFEDFQAAKTLSDDQKEEIIQSVDDEINQKGIWNNIKSFGKSAYNKLAGAALSLSGLPFSTQENIKEKVKVDKNPLAEELKEVEQQFETIKKEFISNNKPVPSFTEEDKLQAARELKIEKRIQSQSDSQVRSFLKESEEKLDSFGLSEKDKVNLFQASELASLSEKDKLNLAEQNINRIELAKIKEEGEALKSKFESGEIKSEEEFNAEVEKINVRYQEAISQSLDTYQRFVTNTESIGNVKENLDVLKRNYGWLRNFADNAGATGLDLTAGLIDASNLGLEIVGLANENSTRLTRKASDALTDTSSSVRDKIAKPIAVDDINNMADFGQWFSNTAVASQIPIYAAVAMGGIGIAALGTSAAGSKWEEMQDEVDAGKSEYSYFQKTLVPIGVGASETLSAYVDRLVLANAGRVIRSATLPERKMIAEGMWKGFTNTTGNVLKNTAFEGTDEAATEIMQNTLDIFVLGKKDVSLFDNVTDAMAAGAVMGGLIPASAGLVSQAIKPFSIDNKIYKVNKEILNLEKSLDRKDISLSNRTILESQLSKAKVRNQSLLEQEVGNISNMPSEAFEAIKRIERTQANIRQQAQEIKSSDLDTQTKDQVVSSLKEEFDAIESQRINILNKDSNALLNLLEPSEVIRLKDEAARELLNEANPDGEKEGVFIADEQITKRALENYNKKSTDRDINDPRINNLSNEVIEIENDQNNEVNLSNENNLDSNNVIAKEKSEVDIEDKELQTNNNIEEPRIIKASENGNKYTITTDEKGKVSFINNKGKVASDRTHKRLSLQYAKENDLTEGRRAYEVEGAESSSELSQLTSKEVNKLVSEKSESPVEIAETILSNEIENYREDLDYKQRVIAENLGFVNRESFIQNSDEVHAKEGGSIPIQYLRKDGSSLDTKAQELSEIAGIEITEQDIVDFILENPSGTQTFLNNGYHGDLSALKNRFEEVTGLPATNEVLHEVLSQEVNKKERLENMSSLDFMQDEYFINLVNELEQFKQDEKEIFNTSSENLSSVENGSRNEGQSRDRQVRETENRGDEGSNNQGDGKEGGQVNISKDLRIDKFIENIDKVIDQLDQFGKENLGMNLPLVVARTGLMAMKVAAKSAKSVADIISAGLNAVQQTDWYKNLSKAEQADLDNNFIDYLNKPFETNKNTRGREKIEKEIKEAIKAGKSEAEIINSYSDRMEKMMAKDFFERKKALDPKTAKKTVDDAFEKSEKKMEELTKPKFDINKLFRAFVTKFFDRQFLPKFLLNKAGGRVVRDYIVTAKGASGYAKQMYEKAYDKIYKGLSSDQIKLLDKVIQLRRFIAIDENRKKNGLPDVVHPDYINKTVARTYLGTLQQELGDKAYNDLIARADAYFDAFKDLLDQMYESGIISKESRDAFFDIDYQPRQFLEFLENAETETAHLDNGTTGGLGKEQIQKLEKGLDSALVTDSQYLLSRAMNVRAKTIALNNTTRRLAEFMNEQQKVVDDLSQKDKPTKKEKDIIKYFNLLKKRVKENPIVGFTESGNPKYKMTTPNGFSNAYYWKEGVKYNVLMENEFHEQYFDALKRIFSSPDVKEKAAMYSGTGLVKSIATGNNPTFFITNTPRDFLFISTFSGEYGKNLLLNMAKLTKDAALGIRDIKKENQTYQNFVKYGGMTDFLMDQGKFKGTSGINHKLAKIDNKTRERWGKFFDAVTLQKMQMYSEVGFRMGVFRRSIANQLKELGFKDISEVQDKRTLDDIYTSAASSARNTMDFNQGGTLTKDLDAFIPYLNAATQGTRVMFDNFRERPIETTLRVTQAAALIAPIPIGLSLMFLASGDREEGEDDLNSTQLYNKALKGVSKYDRSNYFIIFNGKRNKQGEFSYYRIAKAQQLTPFFTLTEGTLQKVMRESVGDKEIGTMIEDLSWVLQNNISPVEFGITDNVARNPMLKAALSMSTGYDFFREQDISTDRRRVPVPAEGFGSKSVEDFYKKIGEGTGLSPARMKAAVESIITTPSTSPYVGMVYGGMDAMFSDKDTKQVMQKFAKDMAKSSVNRVVKETSEYNRRIGNKEKIKEEVEKIEIARLKTKFKFDSLISDLKDGTITQKEILSELQELAKENPFEAKRMVNRVKDQLRNKSTPSFVFEVKYANTAKEKALLMADKFGDSFLEPSKMQDKEKIMIRDLKRNGAINREVMIEYMKLVK